MGITWRDRFPSSMLNDKEQVTRVTEKLELVLEKIRPSPKRTRPCFQSNEINSMIDCDEVYDGIFIGDGFTAKNKKYLNKIGVTHVLNAAMGDTIALVKTDAKFYESENIKFFGIHMEDVSSTEISVHFDDAANFIESALASDGKVYVHCFMGISRSSTCVVAFLMLKRGMTAEEALRTVRAKRCVCPNAGFLQQLATLDIRLGERRQLADSEKASAKEGIAAKKRSHTKMPCDLS